MGCELVVFDNDGVLVDSEPISNRILAEYLSELGHPTSYEESIERYMGSAVHSIHDSIRERSGRELPADFDEVFHGRVFEAFREELEPVDGAAEVLLALREAGVEYCLASSGSHERIRVALRKTGLERFFSRGALFSADDVGRGKPAPDLFLHAAAVRGVKAEECVVVEDSPAGVQAARAAGMDVLGFCAMTPRERLGGARACFSEMAELPGLLGLESE
ncbi:HAD family hydrolase [Streptomyces sulphureus]|uniref:HAD family hydrolase n=1 Tax=Streptomyces sulphureus TaxID=47758 RepID=UPI0003694A68|nr:HAD family hydrolase [Streptomyces sulphureus]